MRLAPQSVLLLIATAAGAAILGCGFSDQGVFNEWAPNFFSEPPAPLGPYTWSQYKRQIADGADGQPLEVTVFAPAGAPGPRPMMCWVTGSNQVVHYHQSLHETLASWGYVVIVPTTRPLKFEDTSYHRRNVDLSKQSIGLALGGRLDVTVDPARIATGGHSIGATMAMLVAGEDPRVSAVVLWAPTGSPSWQGLDPYGILPSVTQPVYYMLADFDILAGDWPDTLQRSAPDSQATVYVIQGGDHLYFQQPTGADVLPEIPLLRLTRFEQQKIAIEQTRAWLDETLEITR